MGEVPSGELVAMIEVPSGELVVMGEVPSGELVTMIEVPSGELVAMIEVPSVGREVVGERIDAVIKNNKCIAAFIVACIIRLGVRSWTITSM